VFRGKVLMKIIPVSELIAIRKMENEKRNNF
jgi:hypothetical protein